MACKYGHTEIDGECERPCSGETLGVCRCQTEEEAAQDIRSGATLSLVISSVVCLVGACTATCFCISAQQYQRYLLRAATGSGNAGQAAAAGDVEASETEAPQNPPDVQPRLSPAITEELGEVSRAGVRGVLVRAASRVSDGLGDATLAVAGKYWWLKWLFPLAACAGLAYAGYVLFKDLPHPDDFYRHLGNSLGIFAIVCGAVGFIFVVRAAFADNVLLCIGRIVGSVCVVVPLVSIAGVVWSILKLLSVGSSYHSCELRTCLWNAC